jgi:hypothetical protein
LIRSIDIIDITPLTYIFIFITIMPWHYYAADSSRADGSLRSDRDFFHDALNDSQIAFSSFSLSFSP